MLELTKIRTIRPSRVRQLWTRVSPAEGSARSGPGPAGIVALGAWYGLITGPLELASLLVQRHALGVSSLGLLQMNRHAFWMIPASDLLIFTVVGLLLAPLGLPRSVRARWGAVLVLHLLTALTLVLTFRGLSTLAYWLLAGGLACVAFRQARARPEGYQRLVRRSFPVLAAIMAALVGLDLGRQSLAERRALEALPPAPATPNVLLLVLDTVRAGNMSLYGYPRDTTPNLRHLGERGIRFEHARVPAPWTLPSHASLFTGRWPHELSSGLDKPLDATHPTLAEHLRDRGYATAGFVANRFFCNAWYGLGRGHIHYEDSAVSIASVLRSSGLGRRLARHVAPSVHNRPDAYFRRKNAETINREFLRWLDDGSSQAAGRPFYAFLNYFDAHDPYIPPDGWSRGFGRKPEGRADLTTLQDWHEATRTNPEVDPREVALAVDSYDECIAYLDAQLGRLFEELERRGVLEETIVIVTSDHGEHFGEHGIFGHGSSLYGPVLDVPLLVVGPPRSEIPEGRSISAPVSLRDLPATVSDLVGSASSSPFPGRSLSRFWLDPAGEPEPDPVLAEKLDGGPPAFSVLAEGHSYILNGDGREELYDLGLDPDESRDLGPDPGHQDILARLRDILARLLRGE